MTVADSCGGKGGNSREDVRRRALAQQDAGHVSEGAAAAERASAGIGIEATEPSDWLFGDTPDEDGSG